MTRKEVLVQKVLHSTWLQFPSLDGNLVGNLVRFVLLKRDTLERARRRKDSRNNYDVRDIMNSAGYLEDVSSEDLEKISRLNLREIRKLIRGNVPPFSNVIGECRETLLHLPTLWVRDSAVWLLKVRRETHQGTA